MPTKYDKHTHWMKPFVESADGLVKVDKIRALLRIKAQEDRGQASLAICTKEHDGTYTIRMYTVIRDHKRLPNGLWKSKPFTSMRVYVILETLAHELAHLRHFRHPPEMFELKARLMKRFAKVAKDLGITDLEIKHSKIRKMVEEKIKERKV